MASPTSRPSLEGLGLTPTLLLAMALLLLGCSDDLPSAPATPNTGDSIRETSPPVTRIVERLRERTLSGTADSSLSASVLPENLRARLGVEPGGAGVRFDPSDPDEGDSDEGGAPRISVEGLVERRAIEGGVRFRTDGTRSRITFRLDRSATVGNVLFVRLASDDPDASFRAGWEGRDHAGHFVSPLGFKPLDRAPARLGPDLWYLVLERFPTWSGHVETVSVEVGRHAGFEVVIGPAAIRPVPLGTVWTILEERAVATGRVTMAHETREVLLASPDSRHEIELRGEPGSQLAFGIGILPDADGRPPAAGARFRVTAREDGESDVGSETTLFERTLDPARDPDDRGWHDATISLDELAGRTVRLALVTEAGEPVDAVWSTPVIRAARSRFESRPNLVIVSLDTLRADRLGAAGHPGNATPTLDRFARRSVHLTSMLAQASSTGPSHMTLFSSLYPTVHGLTSNLRPAAPGFVTLAEMLRERGYATIGLTNGGYIRGQLGFQRGFDRYLDEPYHPEAGQGRVEWMVDEARRALADARDRPFFLFLHTYEIHTPYCPDPAHAGAVGIAGPGGSDGSGGSGSGGGGSGRLDDCLGSAEVERLNRWFDARPDATKGPRPATAEEIAHVRRLYDAGVRQTDAAVARLLAAIDELGLASNTWVILLSDHGEDLGDHDDIARHARSIYDEIVRVPFLARLPGLVEGPRRIDRPVGLVDVLPTLAELLALEHPEGVQGHSFARWLTGPAVLPDSADLADSSDAASSIDASARSAVFAENFRFGEPVRISIREGDKKLVRTRTDAVLDAAVDYANPLLRGLRPRLELYDLASDPAETENRWARDADGPALAERVDAWFREQERRALPTREVEIAPRMVERLRELGYLRDDR